MAYSEMMDVRAQVPGIATSRDAAQTYVVRLVMQTVFDVLERQGRSAGLPDALIAAILGQHTVQISYEALECRKATVNHPNPTVPCEFQQLVSESSYWDSSVTPYLNSAYPLRLDNPLKKSRLRVKIMKQTCVYQQQSNGR
ncbi:hypothetical protein KIN20_001626 [Parelaphostrongylus tenuis]|uniref:Uncharacterized protein n=1 Tax=Parelaphostrongylus tenuis TaxID=148309 RepID=A0AAD5MF87_PARTN|nr:hypothetical protein KIN20_001626 [Parelaphostrongylus tenuis]